MNFIKNYLIDHKIIDILVYKFEGIKYFFFKKPKYKNNGRKIYIIGVPQYKNLGDHAIAEAIKKYSKKYLSEYQILEISIENFWSNYYVMKKKCTEDDFIFLIGGGNFGIEYFIMELQRRTIINKFKKNKIIMFPQTIYFDETNFGKKQLKKSINIYKKNANLYLCAREKYSYNIMKKMFYNPVYLIPDIVLFLNERKDYSRNGSMMLMRNDVEKKLSSQDINHLRNILIRSFKTVHTSDTVIKNNVSISERKKVLEDFWDNISRYQLIVTDRLHGMIFAYIVGTPCIVFSNYNHKVKGIYETWLSKVNNIQFCNDINEFEKCLSQIDFAQEMSQIDFSNEFNLLYEIIRN